MKILNLIGLIHISLAVTEGKRQGLFKNRKCKRINVALLSRLKERVGKSPTVGILRIHKAKGKVSNIKTISQESILSKKELNIHKYNEVQMTSKACSLG